MSQSEEWHEPSDAERTDFMAGISSEQRNAAADLIQRARRDLRVTVRRVTEFDGQINEPLGVQFSDGRRYVIAADGTVTDYGKPDALAPA